MLLPKNILVNLLTKKNKDTISNGQNYINLKAHLVYHNLSVLNATQNKQTKIVHKKKTFANIFIGWFLLKPKE